MPVQVIDRALALFPRVAFTNAYGLTETSSTISLLDPDDHRLAHRNEDDIISRRLGSVGRSEEHTSELQSLMRISYAFFCLNKHKKIKLPKTILTTNPTL